jgi:hypothetical protein
MTPLSALSGFSAVVPPGSCIEFQFPVPVSGTNTYLDAGQISVSGAVGPYQLYSPRTGQYGLSFLPGATSSPGLITDGTVLTPGTYNFTGAGGAAVGAFTVAIDYVNTFHWGQQSSVNSIDRSQPFTFNWTGGAAGGIVAMSITSSLAPGPEGSIGAAVICYADGTAGSFTIPAPLLAALPPSYKDANGNPQGGVGIYQNIAGPAFTASGLDLGSTSSQVSFSKGMVAIQ